MAEDNYTEKNVYYETKPIESIKIEIQKKVTAWNLNGLHNIFCMFTIYYMLPFWQSMPNTCFSVHLVTLHDSFIPNFVNNGCANNDIRAVNCKCVYCVCMSGSTDYLMKGMAHFPCTLVFYFFY